ncbi:B12-binding domain-containing radical SAM protein [Salidesulfovibrio onnuriiensis]|uniref:B12-binding domain-containing radical SAM protein n=1 Tax=Salidesulfovibrio onnuriiensis TaxID=2583823 RepID=UPI0011CADF76|nr:radical SAM protein [Salidesulfovibrio onnuriiensis]
MTEKPSVLLLSPSGWQKESINLGLAYLASSLQKADFQCRILDVNRYPMSDEDLVDYIRKLNPILIGISIKTATAREGARLGALLHKVCPEAHISCGGPHMTLCAEQFLKESPAIDSGIMSEGEHAIVQLAEAVRDKESISEIPNIAWRDGEKVVVNSWKPPQDLNILPFPDLDAIEDFSWENFRYPIVTSRGCPFDCIYCCVNKLTGSRKWRFRSPENVVQELETIVREKGITHFEIWDDNFTLDLKRAKKICRLMIEKKLNLSWYCHNGIRADRIDLELAKLMKQAGCTSVAFGIESGNPKTFDSIKKGEPLSAVVEAVRLVKKVGINAVGYFIIGLPGDNLERFVETVRFQRKLKLHHYVFGMLIPYPHTEVWDMVEQNGTMFCEITETQHFSDDIVPISFELPGFPKEDMVRAFYIAKYFDLLGTVDGIRKRQAARAVYMATPDIVPSLAGMIIASGTDIEHIVVGTDEATVRAEPSFVQVPENSRITFLPSLDKDLITGESVIVCRSLDIPREILFGNSGLVLIDPTRHLHNVIRVRKPMLSLPLVPALFLSGLGVLQQFQRNPQHPFAHREEIEKCGQGQGQAHGQGESRENTGQTDAGVQPQLPRGQGVQARVQDLARRRREVGIQKPPMAQQPPDKERGPWQEGHQGGVSEPACPGARLARILGLPVVPAPGIGNSRPLALKGQVAVVFKTLAQLF